MWTARTLRVRLPKLCLHIRHLVWRPIRQIANWAGRAKLPGISPLLFYWVIARRQSVRTPWSLGIRWCRCLMVMVLHEARETYDLIVMSVFWMSLLYMKYYPTFHSQSKQNQRWIVKTDWLIYKAYITYCKCDRAYHSCRRFIIRTRYEIQERWGTH